MNTIIGPNSDLIYFKAILGLGCPELFCSLLTVHIIIISSLPYASFLPFLSVSPFHEFSHLPKLYLWFSLLAFLLCHCVLPSELSQGLAFYTMVHFLLGILFSLSLCDTIFSSFSTSHSGCWFCLLYSISSERSSLNVTALVGSILGWVYLLSSPYTHLLSKCFCDFPIRSAHIVVADCSAELCSRLSRPRKLLNLLPLVATLFLWPITHKLGQIGHNSTPSSC